MPDHRQTLPGLPEQVRLSREFRLLVACSWLPDDPLRKERQEEVASLCREGIDWNEFLSLVQRHRVHAIAHAALREGPAVTVPAEVWETLTAGNLWVCGRALKHGAELLRLHALLAGERIPVIPLKGVLLSLQLYGSTRMRESADIDLLVRADDLERADALLRENGFAQAQLGERLTASQREYLKANLHHLDYQSSTGIHLELHCRSFLATPEQTRSLWDDPETVHWEGGSFTVLNADNQFLYLCEHGSRHKWFRLKWLSDLAMLIVQNRVQDWERLLALARRLDLQRTVAHSVQLAAWLYRLELPPTLRHALSAEQRYAAPLSVAALCALQNRSGVEAEIFGTRFTAFRRLFHVRRLRPALRYREVWRELAVSYLDFDPFPLPDRLFWLYVPLRPLFWGWRKLENKLKARRHSG